MDARKPKLWRPLAMPRYGVTPYPMPAVEPLADFVEHPRPEEGPIARRSVEAEPLQEIMRQPMADALEGLSEGELSALAQAAARRARKAEEETRLHWYREPFFYAVQVGAQGVDGAPIASGAVSAAGRNRIGIESTSNFEAYFPIAWWQNTVTGAIQAATDDFRTKVFYAGSKGVTSEDQGLSDQLRRDNAWGTAQRPTRNVWPQVFPASTEISIEVQNDGPNPMNFQFVYWGNKVFCGDNPRKLLAKPPFRREPFRLGISFLAVPGGATRPSNVRMLEHADFELLYITQASPDGVAGDFELDLAEADGGNKDLMNVPIRRDAGFGTVQRPTILTWPRYYVRGSRILGMLTNRDPAAGAHSYQICLHGNLII